MRPFSLLVKPAGPDCNLRCAYCFYLAKQALYPDSARHRMTDATLDRMIRSYMATEQPQYVFGWQGGEPTLMGLDFFRRVTDLQQQCGRSGATVANGLQTNATLIDDAFARHLAEYRFLVGASLDGPPEVHDQYRKTPQGQGSHAQTMQGIEHLRHHGVAFNILVLVSQANVRRAREVYAYLKDQGFAYHQYIPCVELGPDKELLPFAISGPEWGEFLCELFDTWYAHDTRRVSVRRFDSIIEYLVTGLRNTCVMGSNCRQYLVVEHNGDLYPCDFFVERDLRLGNLAQTSWQQALDSPVYHDFGAQKARWNQTCEDCPHLDLCMGDCLKHRVPFTGDPRHLSVLCAGWRRFYDHCRERLERLAATVRAEQAARADPQPAPQPAPAPSRPPGRNDPCPCGSGRKYKKCCGR